MQLGDASAEFLLECIMIGSLLTQPLELGAMMRVTEIRPRGQEASVSWTGNTVSYYAHEIDRTRVSVTLFFLDLNTPLQGYLYIYKIKLFYTIVIWLRLH